MEFWISIVISVVAIPAGGFLGKFLIQHGLNRNLENHKSRLGAEADRLRSGLERRVFDHSLWAQQRHAATAKLYSELRLAEQDSGHRGPLPVSYFASDEGLRQRLKDDYDRVKRAEERAANALAEHALYLSPSVWAAGEAVVNQFRTVSDALLHDIFSFVAYLRDGGLENDLARVTEAVEHFRVIASKDLASGTAGIE